MNITTVLDQPSQLSERQRRIYDFLNDNPVAVLSSIDEAGRPHGAVIYYMINSQFEILFLTRSGTTKYQNLKHRPAAMLTVCNVPEQTTVQISGEASEITDPAVIKLIAQGVAEASSRAGHQGRLPVQKLKGGEFAAFRIAPLQLRLANYAHPAQHAPEAVFESFESFDLRAR